RRESDGWDREHGRRAGELVRSPNDDLLALSDDDLDTLNYSCAYHTDGLIVASVPVQTCWYSDRLDMGRIGVQRDPRRLFTPAARDPKLIEWACSRSHPVR